jgi:hypothetical protein
LATGIAEAEGEGIKATVPATKPTKQSHFMQSPPNKNETKGQPAAAHCGRVRSRSSTMKPGKSCNEIWRIAEGQETYARLKAVVVHFESEAAFTHSRSVRSATGAAHLGWVGPLGTIMLRHRGRFDGLLALYPSYEF